MEGLQLTVDRLGADAQREGFWDDAQAAQQLLQQRAVAEDTLKGYHGLERQLTDLKELCAMAAEAEDQEVLADVQQQLPELQRQVRDMELSRMLSGPVDKADAIVTIHPGAGGVDAQDWAEMLMRMYLRWSERRQYQSEVFDLQAGDEAGLKSASFAVRGTYAYGRLRAENGVHRLIRISPFDANARRHTAFAAVFIVPDLGEDEGEIEIKSEDLRVDTYRASGAGGQHVNRTESAIRITHIPSGIVVQCQAERSQHKNRATAMKMLRGRLYEKQRQEQEAAFQAQYGNHKLEIGFGSQVRSYTLAPYRMVKDERTDHKVSNVDAVLDGGLDEFIEVYLMKHAEQSEKEQGEADRGE